MPPHLDDAGLVHETAGVLPHLIAKTFQKIKEGALQLEAISAPMAGDDLLKQRFRRQREGDALDKVQIFVGNGKQMLPVHPCEILQRKLPRSLPVDSLEIAPDLLVGIGIGIVLHILASCQKE